MLWQIGVVMVSAAVVILIGVLIPLVLEARRAIRETQHTLGQIQLKLEQTAEDSRGLIRQTRQLTEDIQRRVHAADAFVEAMERSGEAANRLSKSVKLVSATLSDTVMEASKALNSRQDTMRDLLELASLSAQLWQRWHKASKPASQAAERTDEQS
jgi:uncharacterized protein YoxC